jgi:CheY-like chemotaxis protein
VNLFRARPQLNVVTIVIPDPTVPVREPKTIIVVEDDEGIRETMAALLEDEGFRVLQAENGREGLTMLREAGGAVLVLLDLWMPIMNGWQMMEALRADPALRCVPVVVISAAGEVPPPDGAKAFLKKPVRLETLLEAVNAHRLP